MERRLTERTRVVLPVKLRQYAGVNVSDMDGEIVNINDTGACIVSDTCFEVNSKISFNTVVSSRHICMSKGAEEPGIISGIVWVESPLNETYGYRYGLKFLEPSDRSVAFLKEKLRFEEKVLSNRIWDIPHPDTSFPSLPLTSALLDGLSPSSLSVDVTNLCNLKCKHCFWHSYKEDLSTAMDEGILNSVRNILDKFPSITNITWYGGEPLINKGTRQLLEEGIKLRKNNLVITNGTFSFPDWRKDVHFAVSVDGTVDIHNMLRGACVYSGIKKNIVSAVTRGLPVALLYCINAVNIECIEEFLKEWMATGIIGVAFTTYTPMRDKLSSLTLSDIQRDKIASMLLKMKGMYKERIGNTKVMIELIRAKYGDELARNCPMNIFNKNSRVYSLHMCNDGSVRIPCALGMKADHAHCRSITKIALYAGKVLHDRESFLALLKMYLSKGINQNICR